MSLPIRGARWGTAVIISSALALCSPAVIGLASANAADRDHDNDGMPNRWERVHGLNTHRANAREDKDRDRLSNVAEYRRGVDPEDQDSDNDGHDDGDEVKDGYGSTDVDDRDSDEDDILDGDEDSDHDGVDNEDEDDADEECEYDDDDRDQDNIDDEDENELHLRMSDGDSDDDGVRDGEEDRDSDGTSNEDEDDDESDVCDGDSDDDGESDEDEEDVLGTIASFDEPTGSLQITTVSPGTLMFVVTDDTEIEFEDCDEDGTTADLVAGAQVAEVDIDDDTGTVEEIELYRA